MSLTSVAALIAAVSFAVLACAGVYLAVRLTRVLGDAATLVRETRADQQDLLARANAAVDRANAQLDRTETVSASMDELGDGMTELAGQLSALAGLGRTLAHQGEVVRGGLGAAPERCSEQAGGDSSAFDPRHAKSRDPGYGQYAI